MTIQETGGTRKTIERGVAHDQGDAAAAPPRRSARPCRCPRSCWRSSAAARTDIPASPPIRRSGYAADLLVEQGGTAVLCETPEIYGAEHLLTRRAATQEIGEKLVGIIRWWEDYTARNKGEMNNNPSPGNKAGGLTTILEKSLGAAAKGGTTTLRGVYHYAEPITQRGFVFMDIARLRSGRRHRTGRLAAATSSASPPAAARPSASSRRRPSSSPPIPTCTAR